MKGYPLPKYDEKLGKYVPNPDRKAEPMPKTKVREAHQVSHSRSKTGQTDASCLPAGDPLDDLRAAAPHLFAASGDLLSAADLTSFDLRDAVGRTPMHLAAGAGGVEVVQYLLGVDADPDARCLGVTLNPKT